MSVVIIDYGMSNLGSISRALEICGACVKISSDPKDLKTAEKIILPGVGSFFDGIKNLHNLGLVEPVIEEVLINKTPLLGICLGMQLLASFGTESGNCQGLGLINGQVIKMVPKIIKERIPHVGWNDINILKPNILFKDIKNNSDFYFVHSYHFVPENTENIIATADYCGNVAAAINHENIYGVQFHPEKSMPLGFKILENFLKFS
ncbi:imidazole glycerol phosphate synthase subunit HisH [Candidatus Babeliales bacterium]|nr:imidazole glycerol phosphate synthase subunit HisH [Candidatus Babeliales bacterium]